MISLGYHNKILKDINVRRYKMLEDIKDTNL